MVFPSLVIGLLCLFKHPMPIYFCLADRIISASIAIPTLRPGMPSGPRALATLPYRQLQSPAISRKKAKDSDPYVGRAPRCSSPGSLKPLLLVLILHDLSDVTLLTHYDTPQHVPSITLISALSVTSAASAVAVVHQVPHDARVCCILCHPLTLDWSRPRLALQKVSSIVYSAPFRYFKYRHNAD